MEFRFWRREEINNNYQCQKLYISRKKEKRSIVLEKRWWLGMPDRTASLRRWQRGRCRCVGEGLGRSNYCKDPGASMAGVFTDGAAGQGGCKRVSDGRAAQSRAEARPVRLEDARVSPEDILCMSCIFVCTHPSCLLFSINSPGRLLHRLFLLFHLIHF